MLACRLLACHVWNLERQAILVVDQHCTLLAGSQGA